MILHVSCELIPLSIQFDKSVVYDTRAVSYTKTPLTVTQSKNILVLIRHKSTGDIFKTIFSICSFHFLLFSSCCKRTRIEKARSFHCDQIGLNPQPSCHDPTDPGEGAENHMGLSTMSAQTHFCQLLPD